MTMTVVRIIYASFPPDQVEKARQNWKEKCAPLMIRQPGCVSEELLRCTDNPGEFISYSEWDSLDSIRTYLASADHQEIKRQNENITGAQVVVKHYELVG
jgi:heme-degrading monooxygenase HmoA